VSLKAFGLLFVLAFSLSVDALELEYLNQVVLPHKMNFKKTSIGGLSGLYFDPTQDSLFAVSDDRGNVNEPRIYEFKISAKLKEFKVEPKNVIFLTVNESQMSHQSTHSKTQLFSRVLDLEGISAAPWGDFLLTNEGDMNKKPRVSPQLLNVKKDGTIVREFEVPAAFLPEPTGEQKNGVRNNYAFEGLAANPNGKEWIVATEGPLVQDPKTFVRFIQYQMPEAWVLKPAKEFHYPLVAQKSAENILLEFQKGISEITYLDEHRLLVLERMLQAASNGLQFQVQIYETDLKTAEKDVSLSKSLVLNLQNLKAQLGKIENFEGMTLGPLLSDGRRSLILVSDDNFMRDQRTQFLFFAIKE
jgi:hypothetical protein